ncbi:RING-type E3 ubiquitin transferase [Trifolium repens]|nr:RING-type E3 ubiquitin transferase [Trifolium repens]
MANPHPHGNYCFPFTIDGVYSGDLAESQQRQNPQQQPQQEQAYVSLNPNPYVHASNVLNSPTLATLFDKQNQETEQFVRIQNDQLKIVLQQQREQQVDVLRSLENYSQQVLIGKDGEIAEATLKNKMLGNLLNSLEVEN